MLPPGTENVADLFSLPSMGSFGVDPAETTSATRIPIHPLSFAEKRFARPFVLTGVRFGITPGFSFVAENFTRCELSPARYGNEGHEGRSVCWKTGNMRGGA